MPKARVSVYLENYPWNKVSFELEADDEDVKWDYGDDENALYDAFSDWAHEEVGQRMIVNTDIEILEGFTNVSKEEN